MHKHGIVGIEGSNGFVGCGFAVTPRHILTCAHVVNAALGRTGEAAKPWPLKEELINISFPFLKLPSSLKAKVVYWRPPTYEVQKLPSSNLGVEEDIAGLELLDSLDPSLGITPVHLEDAIAETQFKVFGYPKKTSQGAIAEGKIQGKLPLGWFQIDGICPEGLWAEPGYSGTAVWKNSTEGACYGMVVAAKTRDDGSKTAYMIPSQKLKSAIATLGLLDVLGLPSQDPEARWKIYQEIFQKLCDALNWWGDRRHPGLLSVSERVSEMVRELGEMPDSDRKIAGEPVTRILEFAARLANHPNVPDANLLRWGQAQFSEFLELKDQLKLAETCQKSQSADADPCLLFEVSSEQAPYKTRAFWLPDAQSYEPENSKTYQEVLCWDSKNNQETIADLPDCSLEALPDRLSGYFRTCVERDLLTDTLRLEMLLPLSLMDQPIELNPLTHNRYSRTIPASEFEVVVRCSERTTRPYRKDCLTKWQANWEKVQQHLGERSSPCLKEVSPLIKPEQLKAHYRAPLIVGFKVSDVPQRKLFEALLGAAAPVAVWLRYSPSKSTSNCKSLLQSLEDFLDCKVSELLQKALKVRAEAIAQSGEEPNVDDFMIGHHLSLLWENPQLLPPLATKTISK